MKCPFVLLVTIYDIQYTTSNSHHPMWTLRRPELKGNTTSVFVSFVHTKWNQILVLSQYQTDDSRCASMLLLKRYRGRNLKQTGNIEQQHVINWFLHEVKADGPCGVCVFSHIWHRASAFTEKPWTSARSLVLELVPLFFVTVKTVRAKSDATPTLTAGTRRMKRHVHNKSTQNLILKYQY